MDQDAQELAQVLWDECKRLMSALPRDTALWTRTVHQSRGGFHHVIVRWVQEGEIRFVNLAPKTLGYKHSGKESGAYVVSEVGTNPHILITRAIGKALHGDPTYFRQRYL